MGLTIQKEKVRIPSGQMEIEGALWMPPDALGVVVIADSSVGARLKPPNDFVGAALRSVRLATLWLDLPGATESNPGPAASDLRVRLDGVCSWLGQQDSTASLPVCLFGSGEAGAAALELASGRPQCICAVVVRGARVDLVETAALVKIAVPTMLIVGSLDEDIIAASRGAYAALHCKKRLEIIPGGTHSFDEPGSPEVVARLARAWFLQHAHFAVV
jgi:putative phosphoribosyl transferase